MGQLSEIINEELQVKTVFTIPLFGGIPVSESVVVTWILMAVMILGAFLLTRNMKLHNILMIPLHLKNLLEHLIFFLLIH